MDWPVYVILGILAIIIVVGLIIIYKKVNQKDVSSTLSQQDYVEIGKLHEKMAKLETSIPSVVKNTLSESQEKYLESQIRTQKDISSQLRESFDSITKDVSQKLEAGFKSTTETFGEVKKELGAISEAQKSLESVSTEVSGLRRVLESNQARGRFGEIALESIVRSVFGEEVHGVYEFQKELKIDHQRSLKPDVTIYLPEPDYRLCIDSKFPLSSYAQLLDDPSQGDILKKFKTELLTHVKKVKGYIVPELTAGYALMFIPSDGIFAYIHTHLFDVVELSYNDNVMIVSPSTLQPILTTINMLRLDRKRAENVQLINEKISGLRKQFDKFSDDWDKLSRSIKTTINAVDGVDVRVRQLIKTFDNIKSINIKDESQTIDTSIDIALDEIET